jgi:hypothetical protein
MTNKDHMLLEQLYSKVKPSNILNEEMIPTKDYFVAKMESVKDINVYDVGNDAKGLFLSVKEKVLNFSYKLEFDYASWGIEGFRMAESMLSPFTIIIADDYSQEDFSEQQEIIKFTKNLDTGLFKVDNLVLEEGKSLSPTMIDLWVRKVGDKWELVEEKCEISFIRPDIY